MLVSLKPEFCEMFQRMLYLRRQLGWSIDPKTAEMRYMKVSFRRSEKRLVCREKYPSRSLFRRQLSAFREDHISLRKYFHEMNYGVFLYRSWRSQKIWYPASMRRVSRFSSESARDSGPRGVKCLQRTASFAAVIHSVRSLFVNPLVDSMLPQVSPRPSRPYCSCRHCRRSASYRNALCSSRREGQLGADIVPAGSESQLDDPGC